MVLGVSPKFALVTGFVPSGGVGIFGEWAFANLLFGELVSDAFGTVKCGWP